MSERGYHHGDLRNALLAATAELVRERGARGFSVSEAARRVGVSTSAPYRHFADRDAMLAAAALTAFRQLEDRFGSLAMPPTFADAASLIATEYLGFAREDPARFEVMFAHGIEKTRHQDLLQQTLRVQEQFEAALSAHLPSAETTRRAAELWSLAHGIAALAIGGNVQHMLPDTQIADLADSTARAWARGAI
ncbi:TetR/AcrR family transcriptional regulator [Homoserinibacter sp. YIM 151385]|uniref:TetR/AcrR family transcriptional regulator n=1 Tax=Homoserinibacter sp. YIM 151385 TaxID=2985506 RepID=UPI0022F11104|nr:TetR/AcrR family transcriptional regulator [Homoserinibacter sp. YIM 151385]WBU38811.1 TetR/AcrR family transcriptional regulator [Homoserinibacter sp. YIM 151385]